MKLGLDRRWTVTLFASCALASLASAPALAQIERPTESELDAAPSQFQNLVHGRSNLITQTGPLAPKAGPGGAPPGMSQPMPIPNPSHDPRDLTGYWTGGGGPPGLIPGGGKPGGPGAAGPGGPGGPGGAGAGPRPPGVRGHTVIDANRLCTVNLGVQVAGARIYQDKYKLTLVYGNELRARRIYFASQHTPDAPLTYNGDSIAHWEGNTLVVDTTRIKQALITALDFDLEKGAHTLLLSTPNLHVIEHITKSADGSTLTDHAIWIDPSVSSKPYETTTTLNYSADPLGYDSECEDIGDMFGPNYGTAK